jgi:Ion transport protein/Cyclic nucleotide-binding domain
MIDTMTLNIPKEIVSYKYASVWQRARIKLKIKLFLKRLGRQESVEEDQIFNDTQELNDDDYNLERRYSMLMSNFYMDSIRLETTPLFVIHPESKVRSVWNIILACLLLYTAILMPYLMAFTDEVIWDAWFYISLIIDILFLVDFVLNCFTAYYDNESVLIVSHKQIFTNYLKGWFLFDLVACFPFDILEIFESSSSHSSKSFLRIVKVPRVYRLLRVSKLFKLISQSKYTTFEKFRDYMNIKHSTMRLITSSFLIMICVHISACFWYYTAKIYNFDETTWVYNLKYLDGSAGYLYLTCVYWAIATMITVGYGDIHPFNNLEKVYCILWMGIGIFFISFSIGRIASVINSTESKDNILIQKLAAIDEFCSEANIDKDLHNKLRKAIRFSTDKQGGSWNQKEMILNELPRALKYELSMNMFQGAAKKIEFFKLHEPAVVASIVPLLQPIFINRLDFIYKENEIADEIYFICKGKVSYNIGEEFNFIGCIQRGNYFGDIEIVLNSPRLYHARGVLDSELFIMNRDLIQTLIGNFPLVWEEMSNEGIRKNKIYRKGKVELEELLSLRRSGKLKSMNFKEFQKIVKAKCKASKDYIRKSESHVIRDLVYSLDKVIAE